MARKRAATQTLARAVRHTEAVQAVRTLLAHCGEDTDRLGLQDTPSRVVKAMLEMTEGLNEDPATHLTKTFDDAQGVHRAVVLVDGIEFTSLCEHHLLPFVGVCHVAYIPDRLVTGLSKIPRMVLGYAKRPQVQERMTSQIADAMQCTLKPYGVAVMIVGRHSCMGCRGVRQPHASMTTSVMLGEFQTPTRRDEFYQMLAVSAQHKA